MSKYEQLQSKPPKNFKRLIGVVDLGYLGIKKQHKNIQIHISHPSYIEVYYHK